MKIKRNVPILLIIGILFIGLLSFGVFHVPTSAAGNIYVVTNDQDSGAGSLRQAILDANADPGHDTIVFSISGTGTGHVIQLLTLLPPITDPVLIDGSSQPGYSTGSPMVEITGSVMNLDFPDCKGPAAGRYRDNAGLDIRMDPGTSIDASGTTILGLIVSEFCQGITASGEVGSRDGGTAYGCTGGGAKISNVTIRDNIIQGNDQGNAALDLCNATDSLVQGNYLDNQSDNIEVAHSEYVTVVGNRAHNGKDGLSLVNAHFITVQGNEFIETSTGIHMKFDAADNIVTDNVMTDVERFGLALSDNNLASGNTITGSGWFGIEIRGGSNNIVEDNTLTDNGFSRQAPVFAGIVIGAGSRRALGVNCSVNELGEPYACDQDAEWNPWRQSGSFDNIVRGNLIANNNGPGILVGGVFNEWVPGTDASTWDPEVKAFFGNTVYYSQRNSLSGNTIYGNAGLGIDLSDESQFLYHDLPEPFTVYFVEIQAAKPDGLTPNDSGLLANGSQDYPLLESAKAAPGRLVVNGTIDSPDPRSVMIEFFAHAAGDPSGHGEGETYLGMVTPNVRGKFTTPLASVPVGTQVTAIATDAAGNTSEFARSIVATLP